MADKEGIEREPIAKGMGFAGFDRPPRKGNGPRQAGEQPSRIIGANG